MTQINHPDYYTSHEICGLEAIDIIDAYGLNFSLGNVVKYILRAGRKHDNSYYDDLRKALWYLQHEINRIGGTS